MFDALALSKYLGVLGALVGAGFGLPIPEEIPVVTAGAIVGHDVQAVLPADRGDLPIPAGLTRWWIMLPLCIGGVVLSDCVLYFAGRRFGPWLLSNTWVRRRLLTPEKRARIEANFRKRGVMILLGARLTPGIRTPVFLMAGILRMPFPRFLLADALYAIPGVNLLFWLAYWFTDQFVEAVEAAERHKPTAVLAVLAAVGGVILYRLFVGRKVSTGDPEDIPALVKPVGTVTHAVEQTIEKTAERTGAAAAYMLDKMREKKGEADDAKRPDEPHPVTVEPGTP